MSNPNHGRWEMQMVDEWVKGIFADPVTKKPANPADYVDSTGQITTRVELRGSPGYHVWSKGQRAYERWIQSGSGYRDRHSYEEEIAYDAPIYDRFHLAGQVLDVGGGIGTVRQFLPHGTRYLSIDPIPTPAGATNPDQQSVYTCLQEPLNFICGSSEFLPLIDEVFDWVHMRSMLDHVHIPDLALLEAKRVMKPGGSLLIGLTVEGGRRGSMNIRDRLAQTVKHASTALKIDRFADYHTWHPTYRALVSLVSGSGLHIWDEFWQPHWQESVVYLHCKKESKATPV